MFFPQGTVTTQTGDLFVCKAQLLAWRTFPHPGFQF
jgi:hypothetical protein